MTEGQLRFQTLNEEKRHNRVVEEYGRTQAQASATQAAASAKQAQTAETRLNSEMQKNYSEVYRNAFTSAELFTKAFSNMIGAAGRIASLFA